MTLSEEMQQAIDSDKSGTALDIKGKLRGWVVRVRELEGCVRLSPYRYTEITAEALSDEQDITLHEPWVTVTWGPMTKCYNSAMRNPTSGSGDRRGFRY